MEAAEAAGAAGEDIPPAVATEKRGIVLKTPGENRINHPAKAETDKNTAFLLPGVFSRKCGNIRGRNIFLRIFCENPLTKRDAACIIRLDGTNVSDRRTL